MCVLTSSSCTRNTRKSKYVLKIRSEIRRSSCYDSFYFALSRETTDNFENQRISQWKGAEKSIYRHMNARVRACKFKDLGMHMLCWFTFVWSGSGERRRENELCLRYYSDESWLVSEMFLTYQSGYTWNYNEQHGDARRTRQSLSNARVLRYSRE